MIADSVESLFLDDCADITDGIYVNPSDYYMEIVPTLDTQDTAEICVREEILHPPKKSFFKRMNRALSRLFLSKI